MTGKDRRPFASIRGVAGREDHGRFPNSTSAGGVCSRCAGGLRMYLQHFGLSHAPLDTPCRIAQKTSCLLGLSTTHATSLRCC
jgi:hypothetical protein